MGPVPCGLEKGIGKASDQDVLDRFFTQIVIDAIGLAFLKVGTQARIKVLRGF